MRNPIKIFFFTLSFLSNLPVYWFVREEYKEINPKGMIPFFPVVGAFCGILNILWYHLFIHLFSREVTILLILLFQYVFFNLFHFDGFLDFFEALFSGKREKKEIIKIMKDPHIGSFASFFGFIYLLLKFFLLRDLLFFDIGFLYLYPIIGRVSQVLIMGFSHPAKREGLGYLFYEIPFGFLVLSYIIGFFLFLFRGLGLWWIYILVPLFVSFLMRSISNRVLGGFTGDVVGAGNEVGELISLFVFKLIFI